MKKETDNKPDLPKRYKANPTTGEVLYEYICASDKLRATATLHIFHVMIQSSEESAQPWPPENVGKIVLSKAEIEAAVDRNIPGASQFRAEMQNSGFVFPIPFFEENPCPLSKGSAFCIVALLVDLCKRKRYDEMDGFSQALWDKACLINRASGEDLAELSRLWTDPTATIPDLRKAFRDALKRRGDALKEKTSRGRPSLSEGILSPKSALNDLWHYKILQGVAEHTSRSMDELLAPDPKRDKKQSETLAGMISATFSEKSIGEAKKEPEGFSVKLARTPDGGLDTTPIKEGASKAVMAIQRIENASPNLSDAVMAEAKRIQALYAGLFGKEMSNTGEENTTEEKQMRIKDQWRGMRSTSESDRVLFSRDKTAMPRLP